MAVKEFTKEYLLNELDVLGNSVSDVITDTSRWSVFHTIVFQDKDGKFYEASYSCGATECQDESPWEYEQIIECTEVEQREVPVNKWVSVDAPKPKKAATKKAKKEEIEVDPVVIEKKVEMDSIVSEIKVLDYKIAEFNEMQRVQEEQLKARFDSMRKNVNEARNFAIGQLRALVEQVNPSSTKTQLKVALPNGDVVVKKATQAIDYDKSKLLDWAEEKGMTGLIAVKETKDFKWAEFKKQLAVTDAGIVDTETGELVNIEGLAVKEVAEEVQVKY